MGLLDRHIGQIFRIQQPRIHAHARLRLVDGRPVRNTTALAAAVELEHPVVALVDLRGAARFALDADLGGGVVGPEGAIAPADGAVAGIKVWRGGRDGEVDEAAVAGSREHGRLIWTFRGKWD